MFRGVRFVESADATIDSGTFRTFVAGRQALAWTPAEMIAYSAVGFTPSDSDPLAHRASIGWKGFVGGTLIDLNGGPRYVVIESDSSLAAYLP